MPSQSAGNISTDRIQASLASLADAADALVQAAATLAAAARATAEVLSGETQRPESPEESQGINLGRGSDFGSEIISSDKGNLDVGVGEEGRSVASAEDQGDTRPIGDDTAEQGPKISNQINSPYRLLVDSEADVLLSVCALIDKRQKVVCYMPCGIPPLETYKQLIEQVTEIPIYIMNSPTSLTGHPARTKFLESHGSVLLVPEALSPKFEIEGENSWVIHVGWPASEAQYTAQRKTHRAQNNILVAYAGGQATYPSGDSIINLTEPWPKDGASFRASVSILRPLYEVILSDISHAMKWRVYEDWIQMHGIHGPRRVEAWTPEVVVQHAHDYLSEVLHWSREDTDPDADAIPTPWAPAVAPPPPLVPSPSPLVPAPAPALAPPPLPIPASRYVDAPEKHRYLNKHDVRPDPVPAQIEFQPTIGHTYFTLHEEFDAIPLMCFIAGKYNKVICFLEGQGAFRPYHDLLGRIAGRVIFFPKVINDDQATEEAAARFLSTTSPAILLLAYNATSLPSILSQIPINCCIYWSFSPPLKQVRKNQPLINCETTIIIMTAIQQKGITFGKEVEKHPSAAIPLDLAEDSILAPMRKKTRTILTSSKAIVKSLYATRVYGIASTPRRSLNAEEVARRANQYAARSLLHGYVEDGSEIFPPVAGRPSVPKTTVDRWACLASLADAADALAQAAATVAVAARATIEAFSTPTPASPEVQDNPGINLGKGPDDVHVPVMGDEEVDQIPDPGIVISGGGHSRADQDQTNQLSARTDTPKEAPHEGLKNQFYRLLVDDEADVLLLACGLIDKRQRAICYLPCGIPPLKTYKLLIEAVTEMPVYILDSPVSKQDGDYAGFLENPGSVLLVPETLLPDLELEGEKSWVIHIGWPASKVNYIAQGKAHRAQNNILVAYAGDQSLYPSGNGIVNLTEPWPKDGASFRESASILRPLYEVVLSEISPEM
ncbi:unnamed protein product, partial [Rhizoctonia solani]